MRQLILLSEEDLLEELQAVSLALANEHIELGIDTAAYHQRYWHIWAQAADEHYVTARARRAEYECRDLLGVVISRRGTINSLSVRRDLCLTILAWRRGSPPPVPGSLDETLPLDRGLPTATLAGTKEA